MSKSPLKRYTKILSYTLISSFLLGLSLVPIVFADTTETTFNQTINSGTLSIDVIDNNGDVVVSPFVTFGAVTFSFNAQTATGTLGTSTQKIRLSNPTTTATWNISMAASDGAGTSWTTGTYTYPFDSVTGLDNGRLTVDPSVGTVTAIGSGCDNTNVTKGTSSTFINGSIDSIDLLTATTGADIGCRWDLTGVSLSQRIPAAQIAGAYSLDMTLTAI